MPEIHLRSMDQIIHLNLNVNWPRDLKISGVPVHETCAFINLCKFVQRHVWFVFDVSAAIPRPNRCEMCTREAGSEGTMLFSFGMSGADRWRLSLLFGALWRFHAWVCNVFDESCWCVFLVWCVWCCRRNSLKDWPTLWWFHEWVVIGHCEFRWATVWAFLVKCCCSVFAESC